MFGALAEMLGGIAVVISLAFVGYQLRQQSYIERAKAQRDLLLQAREWISIPSSGEAQFDAIRRCLDDFDGSDAWSQQQFFSWATDVLLIFESVLYMKTDNLVNEGSYIRFEQLILAIARTPGGNQWWKYVYNVIGTDVAEHISKRLEDTGESVPPWNELLPHFKFEV